MMASSEGGISYRPYLNRHRVVYVLHDQPSEAEAMAGAFTQQGFMCSTAGTVEMLVRLIDLHRPDVILVDLTEVQHETDLIGTLRALAFGVRIFILAETNPEAIEVVKAVRAGAISVFVKPFQYTEMIQSVGDELKDDLRLGDGVNGTPKIQGISSLTEREREVLRHVVSGQTNKEAAVALGISPRTIEVHRAAAMRKLGARNTAEMIRIALRASRG